MMPKAKTPTWTIARARQRFTAVIASAAREPQAVYRRSKLVAGVVSPEAYRRCSDAANAASQPSLAQALGDLRAICAQEDYQLPRSRRRDRTTSVATRRR